jgi:glucokinase
VLALDIGGTKLAAGLVDATGTVLTRAQAPTPQGPGAGPEELFAACLAVLGSVQSAGAAPPVALGVGCSGPMRWPAGEVSPLNIPGWRGFPLGRRLEEAFGVPVRVHNDAVAGAAAEHWRGAGAGAANMLGMVVSTGVGGGLILDGKLVSGASGNAGHVGHVVALPDGPACPCGGFGCLEAVASGPQLTAWARERGWRSAASAEQSTGVELAADARAGDAVATQAVRRAGTAIGVVIASVVVLCDLEVVAVGGGLSEAWDVLSPPLEETLARHMTLSYAQGVRVVPTALGPTRGLIGAAALHLCGDTYWPGGG